MLSPQKEGDLFVLVNDDKSKKIPLDEKVWEVLINPDILLNDFTRVIQSYTLKENRDWAVILKEECPTTNEYRALRALIRASGF